MHFLAFIAAVLCITGALCAPSDINGCPRGAIYPHSTDCSKYVTCDHGKTHERACSDGLLFDSVALVCNHAVNVQCGQDKKPEESNEIPDSRYCLTARGQFPHPTDCKKYYDCWDSTVLIRSCPEGTLFDVNKIHCGLAHDVTCKTQDLEEKPIEDKEIPDKKFCLSARGQFPHPADCNKYYNCWDGHIVITRCPTGNNFDANKNYCVESAIANCAVNRIQYRSDEQKQGTDKKPKQSNELPDSRYCLKARGQFPHPTDCKKYYDCWEGTVLIRNCPEGTQFDAKTMQCGFPDATTCHNHEQPTEGKEITDKKFCLSARGQFPHPTDCNKYYNCWDDHIVISTCPAGTGFDATKHICVESRLTNCAGKRIPYHANSANSVPEEQKPDTDKKPEEPKEIPNKKYCLSARGQFPHPTDCKKYYECWDSTVLIQTCPEGTLFDAKKIHCGFADSVTCNVHELEEKPTEEKEIPDKGFCLSARGQFPHPTDCKKYYNCWDGQIVITRCPAGSAFDGTKHYCVESALAYCKVKRIHYRASNGHQKILLSLSLQKTVQELNDFDDEKYIKGVRIYGHTCPAARGQFGHESSCKMFYNCWDEVVLLQRCPNGLLFDPVKRICDSPNRVNCYGKINPQIEEKTADFDDEKYIKGVRIYGHKCPAARGQFGHESSCKMFYNCWDEVVLLQRCPNGLLFDPIKRICDSPDRVNCKGKINDEKSSISDGGNQQNGQTDTKIDLSIVGFKCEGRANGVYETNECRIFVKCVAGRTYQYLCPANLVYDTKLKRCEHAKNVPRSCTNKV